MKKIERIALITVAVLSFTGLSAVGAQAQNNNMNSNMSGDQMKSSTMMKKHRTMRRHRMRRRHRMMMRKRNMMMKKPDIDEVAGNDEEESLGNIGRRCWRDGS